MNISKLVYDFFFRFFMTCKEGQMKTTLTVFQHPLLPSLYPLKAFFLTLFSPTFYANYPLSFPPRSTCTTSRQSSSLSSLLRSTTSRHSSSRSSPSRSSPSRPRPCSFYSMYSYINHQLHFHALPPAPLLTERDPETRLPDLLWKADPLQLRRLMLVLLNNTMFVWPRKRKDSGWDAPTEGRSVIIGFTICVLASPFKKEDSETGGISVSQTQ